MKHIEAINRLNEIATCCTKQDANVLEYAINQLKQAEVFNEPVDFKVSDDGNKWKNHEVHGIFKNQYIIKSIDEAYIGYKYGSKRQKEPLSFTEWVKEKELVENTCEPIKGWRDKFLNDKIMQYTEYLKQFNEK